MEHNKLIALKKQAAEVRFGILAGTHAAKSGHPGGSLSIADVLTYLYHEELRVNPQNPKDPNRDRFVLSKGHCAPALYAVLAQCGFFPKEDLVKLRKVGSYLQGHPDLNLVPGVDMSSGSLGLGLSSACGMALCGKVDRKDYRVYCVIGDGESEEGQIYEAMMFAAHYKLDNLCVILDSNGLQIDGPVADVIGPAPHEDKFRAFGFHVITVDGHDFNAIEAAIMEAKTVKGQPTAIVAKTVKGKGVSFMENQVGWHGVAPNDQQYEAAVAELNAAIAAM